MIRPFLNKNWHEFQKFYIHPRSAVDSAQWDLDIMYSTALHRQDDNALHVTPIIRSFTFWVSAIMQQLVLLSLAKALCVSPPTTAIKVL